MYVSGIRNTVTSVTVTPPTPRTPSRIYLLAKTFCRNAFAHLNSLKNLSRNT